jgi:hypothetical protein
MWRAGVLQIPSKSTIPPLLQQLGGKSAGVKVRRRFAAGARLKAFDGADREASIWADRACTVTLQSVTDASLF